MYSQYFYNENIPPVVKHVFHYDIKSCYPRLLERKGYTIPYSDNKVERNIYIGKLIKNNRELGKILQEETKMIINKFIDVNEIKEEEILAIEKDGLLINKFLTVNKLNEPIIPEFRNYYSLAVRSYRNKKSLLLVNENDIVIKGIKYRTVGLPNFIKKYIDKLNNSDYNKWFKILNEMRNDYLNTNDLSLFDIPPNYNEDKHSFIIKLNNKSMMIKLKLENNSYESLKGLSIDRIYYYINNTEGFIQSILMNLLY